MVKAPSLLWPEPGLGSPAGLPPHHNDPFDRLLLAQAQLEGLTLVTADRKLTAYEGIDLLVV